MTLRINKATAPRITNAAHAPTIALCMIVAEHDAHLLAGAIASARDLVDRVVVVVDPASLHAKAAAYTAGADVFGFPWCDDFAAARNAAIAQAGCDWVLALDADETLHVKGDVRELLALGPVIYHVPVTSVLDDGRASLHYTPRLFPCQPQIRYVGAVHEMPYDMTRGTTVLETELLAITHTGYTADAMARGDKVERNIRLLAHSIAAHPEDPKERLFMGQALSVAGDFVGAVDQYRLALHLAGMHDGADTLFDQAATDLLGALVKQDKLRQAIREAGVILKAREVENPGFWVNLASAQLGAGLAEFAAISAMKAELHRRSPVSQRDIGAATWIPPALQAMALARMGRTVQSLAVFERADAAAAAIGVRLTDEAIACHQEMCELLERQLGEGVPDGEHLLTA